MKALIPIFLFLIVVFSGCSDPTPNENAIQTLRDLVTNGDSSLGFSAAEAPLIWLDTVNFCPTYLIREDSMLHAMQLSASLFQRTTRRYYPVRIGTRLVSTIAFDHGSHGWEAVAYTDSSEIKTFFDSVRADSALGQLRPTFAIVFAPALQSNLLLRRGPHQVPSIILPPVVHSEILRHLHGNDSATFLTDSGKTSINNFLRSARLYLIDTVHQ
jgi:hypothetical protein